jgi:hypothetical protein
MDDYITDLRFREPWCELRGSATVQYGPETSLVPPLTQSRHDRESDAVMFLIVHLIPLAYILRLLPDIQLVWGPSGAYKKLSAIVFLSALLQSGDSHLRDPRILICLAEKFVIAGNIVFSAV